MRFTDAFMDEIRDRVPISTVIGRRVSWDRRKTNASRGDYWACCPFHGEKSPSFHCEDKKGRYHCFGCGVSGDHFRFLTETEGLTFPEAVERIADMAGVPMPAKDEQQEARHRQQASLTEVMELAATFYQEQLQSPNGAKARAYLRERGLLPVTQQAFRLGFAPDSRNALKEYLSGRGVSVQQMDACGLIHTGADIPVAFDRFRDRIMFPIENTRGKIVAFGGRALSAEAKAKYLNSPETEIFRKSELLYNYRTARAAIDTGGTMIVVEGYIDVVALAQAGVRNAVAPMGTALTEQQLDLLWRAASEPVLAFDGDQAGYRAAHRAIDLAFPKLEVGRSLRFAILPSGKDPDDIAREGGKAAITAVLEAASPLREFFIHRRQEAIDIATPEGKATFEKQLYLDVEAIKDEVLKKYYRSHLRLRIYEILFGKSRGSIPGPKNKLSLAFGGNKTVETILGFCVEYPELIPDNMERLINLESKIDASNYRIFVRELYRLYFDLSHLSVADIYDKLDGQFGEILDAVHGREAKKPIHDRAGKVIGTKIVARGHRLRFLFPMIRYNPTLELVGEIIDFLFRKIEISVVEAEYLSRAADMAEAEFMAYQHDIVLEHAKLREVETYLYEQLRDTPGRMPMAA